MTTPALPAPPALLPPVSPDVVAEAVEGLTSRLRKKLDDAIGHYAAEPVARSHCHTLPS